MEGKLPRLVVGEHELIGVFAAPRPKRGAELQEPTLGRSFVVPASHEWALSAYILGQGMTRIGEFSTDCSVFKEVVGRQLAQIGLNLCEIREVAVEVQFGSAYPLEEDKPVVIELGNEAVAE